MPPIRLLACLAAMLAAAPVLAQPAPPVPALAPPPPAQLAPATPNGPAPPPEPPLPLPAGMQDLPTGGWRLRGTGPLDTPTQATLAELGRRLNALPRGRVTLAAQAAGPADDASAARRASLTRALVVKQALTAGGLAETRIDVRALGRTMEAIDAVDILPPDPAARR